MGNAIRRIDPTDADPTWMPRSAASALDDPPSIVGPWRASTAKAELLAARIDPPALLRATNAALRPVDFPWLAERLGVLWASMPASGNMAFDGWLLEATRRLQHLPQDIVSKAIDATVDSGDKFVPVAAAILKCAEPLLRKREQQRRRLDHIVNGAPLYAVQPWRQGRDDFKPDDRCTPEQASEILRREGFKKSAPEKRPAIGPARMPTVQDYIDMGVSREDAERAVARFRPAPMESTAKTDGPREPIQPLDDQGDQS